MIYGPHIPPNKGVRAFILAIAWLILEPAGAFLIPPKKFQTAPPTNPISIKNGNVDITNLAHVASSFS